MGECGDFLDGERERESERVEVAGYVTVYRCKNKQKALR